ncbi:hypothetical protein WN944_023900 [Citrus x changshan-huyou]|uniref:Uncharacterized protein n=1 Tax=Citrus x changshan-huyou TaxID=2935761 RepID=A0AAP0LT83_9ROSI
MARLHWETICGARGRGTCTWLTVRGMGMGSRLLDSLPRGEKIYFLLIGSVGHHSTKTESLNDAPRPGLIHYYKEALYELFYQVFKRYYQPDQYDPRGLPDSRRPSTTTDYVGYLKQPKRQALSSSFFRPLGLAPLLLDVMMIYVSSIWECCGQDNVSGIRRHQVTEEQLVANSNTRVSDSPGSGDSAFRVERATVPRGSGGGAEVVVSLLSSIPELFCSQNPLGSSENVTGWEGFLGKGSLKSLFPPLLLLSLLLLLLNVRGMKGEYSLLILYTCPTWAFSYENNSSPLIPLEWEYRKLRS